jgi:Ala-tRNA(Pro) deacylase
MKEAEMNIFEYLDQSRVDYSVSEHKPAYTAQLMAAEEHEKGQCVAKPVIVKSDGEYLMCVLPAPYRIAFDALRDYLGTEDVKMATEEEIAALFADCEEGAEPPFGKLYGIRTILDNDFQDEDHIVFQAGTHDKAIHMTMEDYLALAEPEIVEFAYNPDRPL